MLDNLADRRVVADHPDALTGSHGSNPAVVGGDRGGQLVAGRPIGGQRVRKLFETRLSAMHSQYWSGQTRIWLRDMHKEDGASVGALKND